MSKLFSEDRCAQMLVEISGDVKYMIKEIEKCSKKIEDHDVRLRTLEQKQEFLVGKITAVVGIIGASISAFVSACIYVWTHVGK